MVTKLLPFVTVNPAENPSDLYALAESAYAGKQHEQNCYKHIVLLGMEAKIGS